MELIVFKSIVLFTAIQRIAELFLSKNNITKLKKDGAFVVKETNYIYMVFLHISWITFMIYQAFFCQHSFNKTNLYIFLILFLLGQSLRLTAIKTLGKRWTTQIVILPKIPAVNNGIFKYIKHPNYLGVVLELFSLPMLIGEVLPAFFFSIINGIILYYRIRLEEKYLEIHNNYSIQFKKNV